MPQKKEETYQQNKVLKVFSKNGNALKKEESPQQNKVLSFFQKAETRPALRKNRNYVSTKKSFKSLIKKRKRL